MAQETLGCAENYRVAIHAQGGRGLWTWVGGLEEITWGRKSDDWSEASVEVAKTEAGADCCGKLGQTHTWAHELSIYRDNDQEPVWQGPIVVKSEKRHSLALTARDMLFWMERRAVSPAAGSYFYPNPTDTGAILRTVITDAFTAADPGLLTYADLQDTGTTSTLDRVWRDSQPVGELLRELLSAGVDVFTVGRRVYVLSDRSRLGFNAYRLDEDAFLDELEVRENGVDASTRTVCVGGQPLDGSGQPIQDVSPVIGTAGGTGRSVKRCQEAIASGVNLPTPEAAELSSDRGVMLAEQRSPLLITDRRRPLGGSDDIGEEDGRQYAVRLDCVIRPSQKLFDAEDDGVCITHPRVVVIAGKLGEPRAGDPLSQVTAPLDETARIAGPMDDQRRHLDGRQYVSDIDLRSHAHESERGAWTGGPAHLAGKSPTLMLVARDRRQDVFDEFGRAPVCFDRLVKLLTFLDRRPPGVVLRPEPARIRSV